MCISPKDTTYAAIIEITQCQSLQRHWAKLQWAFQCMASGHPMSAVFLWMLTLLNSVFFRGLFGVELNLIPLLHCTHTCTQWAKGANMYQWQTPHRTTREHTLTCVIVLCVETWKHWKHSFPTRFNILHRPRFMVLFLGNAYASFSPPQHVQRSTIRWNSTWA